MDQGKESEERRVWLCFAGVCRTRITLKETEEEPNSARLLEG